MSKTEQLTINSPEVRLYAVRLQDTPKKALEAIQIYGVPGDIKRVAAEHERICGERIEAAEQEARAKGIKEGLTNGMKSALGELQLEIDEWKANDMPRLGLLCAIHSKRRIETLIGASPEPAATQEAAQ